MKKKTAKSPKLVAKATAFAALKVGQAEELERQRPGRGLAPLDHDERDERGGGGREEDDDPPGAEAGALALDHREGERRHGDGARERGPGTSSQRPSGSALSGERPGGRERARAARRRG